MRKNVKREEIKKRKNKQSASVTKITWKIVTFPLSSSLLTVFVSGYFRTTESARVCPAIGAKIGDKRRKKRSKFFVKSEEVLKRLGK